MSEPQDYVALNSDYSNIPDFIYSLFNKDIRSVANVLSASLKGGLTYSFTDPVSRYLVLSTWLAAWKKAGNKLAGESGDLPNAAHICKADQDIMNFLAKYVYENNLSLYVPQLSYSSQSAAEETQDRVYYSTTGYKKMKLRGDNAAFDYGSFNAATGAPVSGSVAWLLWYLFHGAHFVVVCAKDNGADCTDNFRTAFTSALKGETVVCPLNSHYGGHLISDVYFLDVDNNVPDPPSFILSLLIGSTTTPESNGFMQLEGWQSQIFNAEGFSRHKFDYETHGKTLWNVSMFGACAFSEKRSTPLFLAQTSFDLTIDRVTHMPLYDGAGSLQK